MSSKQTRNARDDNEAGRSPPDDDGAGVTEHLINRDTSTDPASRQVPRTGDPSNNGGVASQSEDNVAGNEAQAPGEAGRGLTRNSGSGVG